MSPKTVLVGLLIVLSFPSCLRAQTASIAGTITDSTGAAVPNAKITAQSVDTGAGQTAQTDESGVYRMTNLNPGIYEIAIEHPNFKTVVYSQIPLSVDQVLTLDAKLVVSAVRETVRVASESVAPVDLNDAQIGNLVDSTIVPPKLGQIIAGDRQQEWRERFPLRYLLVRAVYRSFRQGFLRPVPQPGSFRAQSIRLFGEWSLPEEQDVFLRERRALAL